MPVPNLQHPVDVVIERVNRSATTYDTQAREPIRTVGRLPAITIPAQVQWTIRSPSMVPAGIVNQASGYLVARKVDLEAKGYSPLVGDKITNVGCESTDLYVLYVSPMAHYPDQRGVTLYRIWFEDRRPAAGEPRG